MELTGTSSRECNCGSAEGNETKSRTGAGADRAAVTTAGMWERTQRAQ